MNIRDFRYLVSVADTLHFGKAAERCFVSQPTLSMQIRKLEQSLGLQLLERSNKRVLLTDAGKVVVERARGILANIDDLIVWSKNHQDPFKGALRVGVIPTLGPYLLPHLIHPLNHAFPELELLLREDLTDNLMARLGKGQLDVAILALPISIEGFSSLHIFKEAFVLALSPKHELAKRRKISIDDLTGRELLLLEEGHCLRDQALEVCATTHVTEKHDFRATSLETLRQMVAGGSGITLLPELAVTGDMAGMSSITVPFSNPIPHRIIGAVWRPGSAREQVVIGLCQVIEKTMAPLITLKR